MRKVESNGGRAWGLGDGTEGNAEQQQLWLRQVFF